ncbi:MAG: DUF4358 domain-containing protein [Clostridia bacterium]|nr:DUF4358 domain-containing protein [Clostridia bacterium]
MRKLTFFIALTCLFSSSCAAKQYRDTISCVDLANDLASEISDSADYSAYTEGDVDYFFGDNTIFEDFYFIYSTSSDDISEIGVFKSESEEEAQKMLLKSQSYISNVKQEKSAFIENYLPEEMQKLNGARAERFGRYVILVFEAPDKAKELLEYSEKLLKE